MFPLKWLFNPPKRLPSPLAADLRRLKKVLTLLGTSENSLGIEKLDSAAQLRALNKYLGDKLGGSNAESRAVVANIMSRVDLKLPEDIRATACRAFQSDLASMQAKGCADLGFGLTSQQVADIHDHLHESRLQLALDAHMAEKSVAALSDVPEKQSYACYEYADLWSSPHILELAASERILDLAQSYLGCVPTLYSINAFWSFPNRQPHPYSQLFHRDWEDYKSLVAFTQLTPVMNPEDGAHYYVEGSHNVSTFNELLKHQHLSSEETEKLSSRDGAAIAPLADRLFKQTARCFDGPAGRSFCSDGYGLHRALVPQSQPRLLLWIRFGTFYNSSMYGMPVFAKNSETSEAIVSRIPDTPRHRYVFRYLVDAVTNGVMAEKRG